MQESLSASYISISINGTDALVHSQSFNYTYILTLPTLLQGNDKVKQVLHVLPKVWTKKIV